MSATSAMRVGWCPGALKPMMGGDGLIVRVKPRSATLTVGQAMGIAEAAARHGNGLLDLTARANLQLRGASEASLDPLTAELGALGLLDADAGAEARRNVVASPLMGLDPAAAFDIRPAVVTLEAALAAATALAPLPAKFGFAVSDGGAMTLAGVSADVRFDALPSGRFAVHLDGDDEVAATCTAEEVPEAAIRLASCFIAASAEKPDLNRMRDLVASIGAGAVLARTCLEDAGPAVAPSTTRSVVEGAREPPSSPIVPPHCVGRLDLTCDGRVVLGIAAPFGRLDAAQLDVLARGAARAGAIALRLTPWRALLVPGLVAAAAARLSDHCAAAGLIVDPADPRLGVAACAGAPGCRRATTAVLDHAARWATLLGRSAGGIALHVSGCAKGCAHPGPATLTLVAMDGRYALVADGKASDVPSAVGLDAEEARRLLATILRLDRRP